MLIRELHFLAAASSSLGKGAGMTETSMDLWFRVKASGPRV